VPPCDPASPVKPVAPSGPRCPVAPVSPGGPGGPAAIKYSYRLYNRGSTEDACIQEHQKGVKDAALFLQTYVQFQTAVVLNQNLKPIFFN